MKNEPKHEIAPRCTVQFPLATAFVVDDGNGTGTGSINAFGYVTDVNTNTHKLLAPRAKIGLPDPLPPVPPPDADYGDVPAQGQAHWTFDTLKVTRVPHSQAGVPNRLIIWVPIIPIPVGVEVHTPPAPVNFVGQTSPDGMTDLERLRSRKAPKKKKKKKKKKAKAKTKAKKKSKPKQLKKGRR